MTLFMINGLTSKSIVTILGCFSGVVCAGILITITLWAMNISGLVDEHAVYVQSLSVNGGIDLRAVIFAAVIIGALGAIMDVAMDLSSSLFELRRNNPEITFRNMFKSGIYIGRDIMGSMANTLILAYIGGTLLATLLYISYVGSLVELLNKEKIIVEILQGLVGSLGILFSIPCTILFACLFYLTAKKQKKEKLIP